MVWLLILKFILALLVGFLGANNLQNNCNDHYYPSLRTDCGWPGITSQECENMGCCYHSGYAYAKSCYIGRHGTYTEDDSCNFNNPRSRSDCGWPGITKSECEGRSCCYDSRVLGVNHCFHGNAQKFLTHAYFLCDNNTQSLSTFGCDWPSISRSECMAVGCCVQVRISYCLNERALEVTMKPTKEEADMPEMPVLSRAILGRRINLILMTAISMAMLIL